MLSVFKNGSESVLDDGSICHLVGHSGWGMHTNARLTESGPQQDGESDLGFRIQPRIAQIALLLIGTSRDDLYLRKQSLMDIFSPSDTAIQLRWTLPSFTRQIDAHAVSLEFDSSGTEGFTQRGVAVLRCPKGVFYDPTASAQTFNLGGGTDSYAIPHSVPHAVGASDLNSTQTVFNLGNAKSFPHLIRINGPITDPVITNQETGYKLDLTGVTIATGQYYDIDLRFGFKTVKDHTGVSKISELSDDSDLSLWSLLSKSEKSDGSNSILVTGSSVTEETDIFISWYNNYLGV